MPAKTKLTSFNQNDFIDFGEVGHGFSGLVLKSKFKNGGQLVARKIIHETRRKRAELQSTASPISRELSIYAVIEERGGCDFVVRCLGLMRPGERGHVHGGLVMEFMELGSLQDLLLKRPETPLPEPIILSVAYSLLSSCHFLHSTLGILHRDIKPSNILFHRDGSVKICDFGEAASVAECGDPFRWGSGGGSLAYMAPERLSGQAHGTAADIWSVGVVLLEMALGRFPFQSSTTLPGSCSSFSDADCSMIELWETIMDESGDPMLDSSRFSLEFSMLVAACLQRDAQRRPAAKDLLASTLFASRAKPSELAAFLLLE